MEVEGELKKTTNEAAAHFVLVHGAGHGGWCWYKVRYLLEKHGHTVTCLDLAGAGIDTTDPNSIRSFDEYNKPLVDFMSTLPDDEKVVLVGHSAGGLSVTDVVHKFGGRIAVAIYVGANMLRSGFCTEQDIRAASPEALNGAEKYEMGKRILRYDFQRKLLYNTSPEEDQVLSSMLLQEPPRSTVFQEARFCRGEDCDKVRRVYIRTVLDEVVSVGQQDMMIDLWPPCEKNVGLYFYLVDFAPTWWTQLTLLLHGGSNRSCSRLTNFVCCLDSTVYFKFYNYYINY